MMLYKALTIAGSDSGGGAGIQADLKTFQELGVYGMSVLTAVTAQNTLGVQGVYPMPEEVIRHQLHSIQEDLKPDAVKTGMLFSSSAIKAVSRTIRDYGWRNVVVDPVMVAKGGTNLQLEEAADTMRNDLIPLAEVVMPNIPEAEILTGLTIRSTEQQKAAVQSLHRMGAKWIILKGGHSEDSEVATDLLYDGYSFTAYTGRRVDTVHTHGTGCTFSAAVAAELAKGNPMAKAVLSAKRFIQAALETPLGIGGGHGPTNHWAYKRLSREPAVAMMEQV